MLRWGFAFHWIVLALLEEQRCIFKKKTSQRIQLHKEKKSKFMRLFWFKIFDFFCLFLRRNVKCLQTFAVNIMNKMIIMSQCYTISTD